MKIRNESIALPILGFAFVLIHTTALGADAPKDGADYSAAINSLTPEAFKLAQSQLVEGLKNQTSLYASVVTLEGQASFKSLDDPEDFIPGKLRLSNHLQEYAYDFQPGVLPGERSGATSCAFDGVTKQVLKKDAGALVLTRKSPFSSLDLQMDNFIFLPYAYFSHEERRNEDPGFVLKAVDLANSSRWKDFIDHLSLKGTATVLGRQTDVAEAPVSSEDYTGVSGSVRYYFDPEAGYFPVGWDVIDQSGDLIEVYRVTTLGWADVKEGVQLPYPKTAIREFFWKRTLGANNFFSKPESTQEIDVASLKVNLPIPEASFKIDRSLASSVFDLTQEN